MALLFKIFIFFLILTGAVTILVDQFGLQLGSDNYWDHRGIFFLFFISFFPRLTLLFSSIAFGGFFWWLGFIFAPRILVATLATLAYWQTNPVLVTMAWLIALSGETSEKYAASRYYVDIRTVKPR